MTLPIRTETYGNAVINHRAAKDCISRLGDPSHATRIALIEGEPETGKTHILRWLASGVASIPLSMHAYPDNTNIDEFIASFSNFLSENGVPLNNFKNRLKPNNAQAEISENSSRFSKGTYLNSIAISLQDPNATPHQKQIAHYALFDELICDLEEYKEAHQPFLAILALDRFDQWDHELNRFVSAKVLPSLIKYTGIVTLIAANSCERYYDDLAIGENRQLVEYVKLRRFRRPDEIVEFIKCNTEVNLDHIDLLDWAETIIEECDGRPFEIANRVKTILALRSKS